MKHLFVLALAAAGSAVVASAPADAAQGCGAGWHRGYYGHCRPNGPPVYARPVYGGPRVYAAPAYAGPPLVVGTYYGGRGWWSGGRYWPHRYWYGGGWRYR